MLDDAITHLRATKRKLAEATERYSEAVDRVYYEIEKLSDAGSRQEVVEGTRLPKGQVRNWILLTLAGHRKGALNFKDIENGVNKLSPRKVSEATIRQTLKRMTIANELEKTNYTWRLVDLSA